MNWLDLSSAALNLIGSVMLGWDLIAAPKRLRQGGGVEELKRDLQGVEVEVTVGGKTTQIESFRLVLVNAVSRRGVGGIVLLILGFLLHLIDVLT